MAVIFVLFSVVLVWTAGLADWMVAYATGIAQMGIWLTLASLIPFSSLWLSLKRQPFLDQPSNEARAHWSILLKA